jgi:hypothetical protein
MRKLRGLLIASGIGLAGITAAAAASLPGGAMRAAEPRSAVEHVQYQSCAYWRQACADLYGWRTRNWHVCMGQAAAVDACRGGYGGPPRSCNYWRQACANLYGWNTQRWRVCMGQPAAIAACS